MFLYSLHHPYSVYIFQAAFGWLSLKEERGWVPEADSWFLFGEVQSSAGLARLEPLFTQPLRPDWEALFSHPGAFQRKPPAEAPRLRYTTLKTIHTASFLLSCCMLQLHAFIIIIQKVNMRHYGISTVWHLYATEKWYTPSARMDSERMIANILHFLSRRYSLQVNLVSLCVLFDGGSLKNWYSRGW